MKKILFPIIFAMLFYSAGKLPNEMYENSFDAVVEVAVSDFLKCRLSRNYNAFFISINLFSESTSYQVSDELIVVDIFPASYRYHITFVDTLGSTYLPSRHIIKNGKLFYWYDSAYGLTEEMVNVLWQFNLADSVKISDKSLMFGVADHHVPEVFGADYVGPEYIPIDYSINGKSKGAHYYFCKNDLSNYKRIITNIGLGGYKPPKVKCR